MSKLIEIKQKKEIIPCCAYVRVSTLKEEQETSFQLQESYWEEKLKDDKERKFCGIFADKGVSGSKVIQRKEYCKMIELALAGFIKEIYTKSIYRFGRNTTEALETIQKLRQHNVAVIFESEEINTLTCSSDVLLKLKAILAEQELNSMSKNVLFHVQNNFKNGIVPKFKIFGYTNHGNNKIEINEEQARAVRLVYTLYLKGYGQAGIARTLDKMNIKPIHSDHWAKSSIGCMLSNITYTGNILLQKTIERSGQKKIYNNGEMPQYYIANNHEPIIDMETFNKVQKKLAESKENYKKGIRRLPYSGVLNKKIECGLCGSKYKHVVNDKIIHFDKEMWVCYKKNQFGKDECEANNIPDFLIKEIILDAYNEFVDTDYKYIPDKELRAKSNELLIVSEKLKRFYMDKLITYQQYQDELKKVQEQQADIATRLTNNALMLAYKKPKTKLKEYQDDIVTKHIEKIVITGYKIDIIFKNNETISKEYKYEHRKYCKNY